MDKYLPWRVSYKKQELIILHEDLGSPLSLGCFLKLLDFLVLIFCRFLCCWYNRFFKSFFWGGVRVSRSLVFCLMFYISLFVLFLLAIVLFVLLRFASSEYPFDIFKSFLQHISENPVDVHM
jgi:hypothetical protein